MTQPALVVVDAECVHGGRLRSVDVQRTAGKWSVDAKYDCAQGCARSQATDGHPASVIDTEGTERWPSLN